MKTLFSISLSTLLIVSCALLVESFDDKDFEIIQMNEKPLSLVFSHNLNGETHPCGCRHFPLGGLPQVAGQMEKIKKKNNMLYVDTGDAFFPATFVPESLKLSQTFAANNLAQALDDMGLKYFVPGDQDFAAGVEFLKEISEKHRFHFLTTNLKSPTTFKHKKWAMVKNGPFRVYLLGVVSPNVLKPEFQKLFLPLNASLEMGINLVKKNGYDPKNKLHRLILLSHSGINTDEKLAKSFPELDWIIGAHSQSFLRYSRDIGKVKIAQVLSRNHYLGEVSFDAKDTYQVHEIRDELKDHLKPNPWLAFLDAHKEQMKKFQTQEQSIMTASTDDQYQKKYITALSCVECHNDQGEHWKKTPHALAYATLLNANEYKNLNCIKCHSIGMGEEKGFNNANDIVIIDEEVKNKKLMQQKFLSAYKKLVAPIESSRELSSEKTKEYTEAILQLEINHQVVHNFSGVQCMHCHGMNVEHPFEDEEMRKLSKINHFSLKNKCLDCHDADQSPSWYTKNENGLPEKPNWKVIDKYYQAFSCPKSSN